MTIEPSCRILSCILATVSLFVAMTSCENLSDSENVPSRHGAIGFVSADADSRAIIDGNDEALDNTIAADAVESGTGFGVVGYRNLAGWVKTFDNKLVTPVTPITQPSQWEYENPQFWEYCPYRFYAYYPYNAAASLDLAKCLDATAANVTFGITHLVQNTWATTFDHDQKDLLIATPKMVSTEENGNVVAFNFHHALCKVGFRLLKEGEDDLEIVDLVVQRVNSGGKASINYDGSKVSWSNRIERLNYSYRSGLGTDKSIPKSDIPYMLLVPEDLSSEVRVVVTLKGSDNRTWNVTGTLLDGGVNAWLPGKTYLYTLTVKGDPVLMDMVVEIADWKNVKINVSM